jgi:hypothetical protein
MSSVKDVLNQLKAGAITAREAGAEIRRVMRTDDGVPDGVAPLEATHMRMAGSLPDRDDHNTFLEVTAAWIGGDLTDEDYWTIYGAATGTRKELR